MGLLLVCCSLATVAHGTPDAGKDFDVPLSGHGHIRSFMYSEWGPDNWIDTIIGLEIELIQYKRTFLVFSFENETDMGRGADPKMIFDPNRGRWNFSLGSHTGNGIPILVRLEANTRMELFRWARLALGLESVNVLYWSKNDQLQRSYALNLDVFLYGNQAALLLYAGWWPHDNQVLRNKEGKVVSGLDVSF
jgi:hypothetical protein